MKIRPAERGRVDALRADFQANGNLPWAEERWLHDMCRRYNQQLAELHAARERARRTNAIRNLGLTQLQVERRAAARRQEEADRADDLGF